MTPVFLKRNFFQRLFGCCDTKLLKDASSWKFENGRLEVDLKRISDLMPGNAIRLENKMLPVRILLVKGDDHQWYAFQNTCQHMGRRMDPVPGTQTIQCCSISKSTYDYKGNVIYGPAKNPIKQYPVTVINEKLIIEIIT